MKELEAKGFKKVREMNMANVTSLGFEKDERSVNVSAMSDPQEPDTIVTVMTATK